MIEILRPKTIGDITTLLKIDRDNHPPAKSKTVRALINIIELYSAKKNKANPIAAYSTLYPLTNSDSASGKSKGALFVSAKILTKNIKNSGKKGSKKNTTC